MNILTIDTNRINEGIDRFYMINRGKTPYVICSEETVKLIISKCSIIGSKEGIENFKNEGKIGAYCGCKILNDNSLKLGEVEIR
jgi:hypothetical protein